MFEKTNPGHPDKMCDRLSGAVVDLVYERAGGLTKANPRVACEVMAGHGRVDVQIETSLGRMDLRAEDIDPLIRRLFGERVVGNVLIAPQDAHLSDNQTRGLRCGDRSATDRETLATEGTQERHHRPEERVYRCGDNGIFKGVPPTYEQRVLTELSGALYNRFPYDGKYIIDVNDVNGKAMAERDIERLKERYKELRREADATDNEKDKKRTLKKATSVLHTIYALQSLGHPAFTICQSHATFEEVREAFNEFARQNEDYDYPLFYSQTTINPLGPWTGGIDVDCGCTNRKLGSDMGDGVTGGGLCGKDLSKADVSVNIVCYLKAVASGQTVTAMCSIGDESVTFQYADGRRETETFADIVEMARLYIMTDCGGSFERFSEWGLIRPRIYKD